MVRQVITIAGLSCVGKTTLINKLLKNYQLRSRFNLYPDVTAYGYLFDDIELIEKCQTNTLLFRWQFADNYKTKELMKIYPQAKYSSLIVWRPWVLHHQDVLHTCYGIWEPSLDTLVRAWYSDLLPLFERHKYDIVDGSTAMYDYVDKFGRKLQ